MSPTMRGVVYTRFGPPEVLELRGVPRPQPGDREVLVRVRAASVNALDWRRFVSQLDGGRALATRGRCVVIGGTLGQIAGAALLGPCLSLFGGRRIGSMGIARTTAGDLALLAELLASGGLVPVIDRSYPLAAAAEAVRYVAHGHAVGKVVLSVAENAVAGPPM